MTAHNIRDICVGIAIVMVSVFGWLIVIPIGIVLPAGIEIQALSPDFWPLIVVGMMAMAGGSLALQGAINWRKAIRQNRSHEPHRMECETEGSVKELPIGQAAVRVAVVIATLFLLYYAIPQIGMVVANMMLLVFLTWFAGERRFKIILPMAIALPLVLYIFFVYVANVPIPLGVFEALR